MNTPLVGQLFVLYSNLTRFLEKRKAEAERIRQKYPDRIPVSSHQPRVQLSQSQHMNTRLFARRRIALIFRRLIRRNIWFRLCDPCLAIL
jgi:hypothetical protein